MKKSNQSFRYLVRLANTKNLTPRQIPEISTRLTGIAKTFEGFVANLRISEFAIEFDLFVTDPRSKTEITNALVREDLPLLSDRLLGEQQPVVQDKAGVVRFVNQLFNEQRYWECHEEMEMIWKKETDMEEKNIQNGIILAASALVHAQKGEDDVCLGMVQRALGRLDRWKRNEYYGLNVNSLRNYMKDILATRSICYRVI